jgi:FlgD Ig-like domain
MRRLIAYTLSAACLAWATVVVAQTGGPPMPRMIISDDGSTASGLESIAATAQNSANAASVRGHGKIDSPRGALVASREATGKADVQFNCSVAAGAAVPSGSTHFRFKTGDLDFRATSHDRLVVSGASVQIGGTGTVNRAAGFRFTLSAIHGATDLFRMRITNQTTGAVVYDNQMGDSEAAPATAVLTNGGIDITAPALPQALKAAHAQPVAAGPATPGGPLGFELAQNFPNPFRAGTRVRFTLPQRSHLRLMVHDIAGRQIATLAVGAWDAGSHTVSWSGRTDADRAAPRGEYFVRMTAGLMSGEQRFVTIRKMVLD